MSSINDQSLTGFKWSAIGEVTIEDSPGHQTDRGYRSGWLGLQKPTNLPMF